MKRNPFFYALAPIAAAILVTSGLAMLVNAQDGNTLPASGKFLCDMAFIPGVSFQQSCTAVEEPTATPTEIPTTIPTEIPTEEPTALPVPTEAPTEEPTAIPTASPDMTRYPLGEGWAGNVAGFYIYDGRLYGNAGGGAVLWQERYAGNQEAFVTLATIDPASTGVALFLLSQSPNDVSQGAIAVRYAPNAGRLQILRSQAGKWSVLREVGATFADGDQFGVRMAGDTLTVYRNGEPVHVETQAAFAAGIAQGGYIGLASDGADNVFDDFGGGPMGAVAATF